MKSAYFYVNYDNIVVLQTYLDTIRIALMELGYECHYVKTLEGVDKGALIVHSLGVDAVKYYWQGYRNFILWQQGVSADESYMRNHSKLRRWILNRIDLFAMKKAKFIFYVSDYMLKHYEKLGRCTFSKKSYVMPCFNENLDTEVFINKDYTQKVFCYVGSLAKWQCFRETVELYKEIEDYLPDIKLKVLTFNVEEGKEILSEIGVRNYEVKQVPKEEVKKELEEASYGFILREDNIVNRVATPTKISSYLSAGVIPIFSSCLVDFDNVAKSKDMKYVLALKDSDEKDRIIDFIKQPIDKSEIKSEYESLFSTYYSPIYHADNIAKKLRPVLSSNVSVAE